MRWLGTRPLVVSLGSLPYPVRWLVSQIRNAVVQHIATTGVMDRCGWGYFDGRAVFPVECYLSCGELFCAFKRLFRCVFKGTV